MSPSRTDSRQGLSQSAEPAAGAEASVATTGKESQGAQRGAVFLLHDGLTVGDEGRVADVPDA